MKTCFKCEKEFLPEERIFFLALEKPYVNLLFHHECYKEIKSEETQYLTQNAERVYNYLNKDKIKGKKDGNI